MNIIDKVWNAHVVKSKEGYPDIFMIDLHLIHEVTSPQAFTVLRERGLPVFDTNKVMATLDHNIPTDKDRTNIRNEASRNQVETLRKNCEEFGITLLDMNSGSQGIVHVVGPELGLTQPGMTIVCGDSHTSTHGAFGSIAFGIGTTEVGHVLATSCLLRERPKTMKVEFIGKRGKGITSKDLILKLIQQIGVGGATGHIIEYTGESIEALSMEQRMTMCNMSIECGARAGLIAPDETTFEYIKDKKYAPKGDDFEKAKKYWQSLKSDPDASYDKIVKVDIQNLSPVVTWGTNPAQSCSIEDSTPKQNDEQTLEALKYVGLSPNQKIEGTKIDYVFIGSCTNARIEDLRAAAEIFKGNKVAPSVIVYVVPGSEKVRSQAIEEGLDKIFTEAGCDFRNPGCSMCLAMNDDKVPAGARCASTSNRNFVGRQGTGSITHLMSPIMAAAAAIEGQITDVRKYL